MDKSVEDVMGATMNNDVRARVFFDVSGVITHLKRCRTYSGIQRVVMNIAAEFSMLYGRDNVFLSFFDQKSGALRCCSLTEIEPIWLPSPALFRQLLYQYSDAELVTSALSKYDANRLKFLYHRTRLDFAAVLRRTKSFERKQISSEDWISARRNSLRSHKSLRERSRPLADVRMKGDFLLLMDSTWSQSFVSPFLEARRSGLHIVTLVHDLIPIEAPETLDTEMTIEFLGYLMGAVQYSDRFLTNSEFTKQRLVNFLDAQGLVFPVQALPLAQTALEPQGQKKLPPRIYEAKQILANYPDAINLFPVQREVREISYLPFVLCVGTIEARKNIMRLAMAWQALLRRGFVDIPRLVFAGRAGSKSSPFFKWMEASGSLQGYVSIINEPNDASLDYLYKKCDFFVMPSLVEGWGLPVGEALSYGKTGVVARSSSLPEVGGDMVEYCDPYSVNDIARVVERLVSDQDHRSNLENKIRASRLRQWRDVANDLAQLLSTYSNVSSASENDMGV